MGLMRYKDALNYISFYQFFNYFTDLAMIKILEWLRKLMKIAFSAEFLRFRPFPVQYRSLKQRYHSQSFRPFLKRGKLSYINIAGFWLLIGSDFGIPSSFGAQRNGSPTNKRADVKDLRRTSSCKKPPTRRSMPGRKPSFLRNEANPPRLFRSFPLMTVWE